MVGTAQRGLSEAVTCPTSAVAKPRPHFRHELCGSHTQANQRSHSGQQSNQATATATSEQVLKRSSKPATTAQSGESLRENVLQEEKRQSAGTKN